MSTHRIIHFICQSPGPLFEVLESQAGLDPERSRELFRLGALYLNKTRLMGDPPALEAGDYLRIHSEPRRYQRPSALGLHLLAENEYWWIFDKPSGISCHATVDNAIENLMSWLSEDFQKSVHVTHRLDVPTSGCLVLAKSPEAVTRFNKLQVEGHVQKEYEALVEGHGLEVGRLTHWMKKDNWAPREVYSEEREQTQRCDLDVLEAEPFGDFTRLRLKLVTGRTHQIRAQMRFMGHPVLNDQMYGATFRFPRETIALRSTSLEIRLNNERTLKIHAPSGWDDWLESGDHPVKNDRTP